MKFYQPCFRHDCFGPSTKTSLLWIDMRLLCLIFSLMALFVAPARADQPLAEQDRVWAMIIDGDIHSLESLMKSVHARSVESEKFDIVRDHNKMFETTHPDAGRTFERWLEAMPNSPYANAALLWRKFHIAWQIRGTKTASETPPDDLAAFSEKSGRRRLNQALIL